LENSSRSWLQDTLNKISRIIRLGLRFKVTDPSSLLLLSLRRPPHSSCLRQSTPPIATHPPLPLHSIRHNSRGVACVQLSVSFQWLTSDFDEMMADDRDLWWWMVCDEVVLVLFRSGMRSWYCDGSPSIVTLRPNVNFSVCSLTFLFVSTSTAIKTKISSSDVLHFCWCSGFVSLLSSLCSC
jgi:hypothetical protein